ncbi:MAG: trypsin-like peptidase domain-containing protein [Candidatus Omnitrophica bacterium]|nr:trypsin-like peptidase domain-containing protein [Candidatus Omnitrophota bacterium]MBI2174868.1 trypsin-like peptidase domain-containing protein [Candidatus Omnitrophota bacterium]MBI3009501.1 trypsin-like peptidase domain-containing protein [Candidatus Omnitrophota bacterium]
MKLSSRFYLSIPLIFTAVSFSFADTIRFRDGTHLLGRVVRRSAQEVVVQMEGGMVSFTPEEIVSIEVDETPPVPVRVPSKDKSTPSSSEKKPAAAAGHAAQKAEGMAHTLAEAVQAVAFIGIQQDDGGFGLGSGAVVSRKGLIVTNHHVVGSAREIRVLLPDSSGKINPEHSRAFTARVLKTNPCYDLALVRVPTPTPHYLGLAKEETVHPGIEVVAIGNPGGLTVSISGGVVSAVRSMADLNLGEINIPACEHLSPRKLAGFTIVQTDAAINPGSSGGPLLNRDSEMVALATAMAGGQGLNFAIHSKHIREFLGAYAKE